MIETPIIFQELKRLRLERGWSQRELARRAALTVPTIINVEKGNGMTKSVCAAANALKYTIRWQFRDVDGERRIMFVAGTLATQLKHWRTRYLDLPRAAFAAPGLSADTIIRIENEDRPTRFSTLERYALLMDLTPVLIKGFGGNAVDLNLKYDTGGRRDAKSNSHC